MKRILIITESINAEDSSGSKANIALINNLKRAGFDLKVYHYTRKKMNIDGIHCVPITEQKLTFMYVFSKVQLLIKRFTGWNLNPRVESFLGFSFAFFNDSYSIKKALKREKGFKPDWVLTLSIASSFRPHKALLGLPNWHDKWLANIHDPFPMHSYPRPYDWVEPGHRKKRNFFLQVTEKAKYLMYPSKLLGDWMESYYPPARGKAIVIPHQIDDHSLPEVEVPVYFKVSDFNILYAGGLMSARNPLGLIEAYKRFLKEVPEARNESRLHFIGPISSYTPVFYKLKENMPQLKSSDGYVPFSITQKLQQLASVNVILEAKGPVSPFLPGKFPHCINVEKPLLLLGPYYSESRRLLGYDYPYWSEIDDVEKILSHIKGIYSKWKKTGEIKQSHDELKDYLSFSHLHKTIMNL